MLSTTPAFSLEPLSEEELYDTSGQAKPTVSIKYSDTLTIDYYNQNVVVVEPQGEVSFSFRAWAYGDTTETGRTYYITRVWPEESKFLLEFDKYPNYPDGIGVSISDVILTGPDGRPLPQYDDPGAPLALPPNTYYLRTKGAPATVTTMHDVSYFALTEDTTINGEKRPDFEKAKNNKLFYYYNSGSARTEIMGYAYIWTRPTSFGLKPTELSDTPQEAPYK